MQSSLILGLALSLAWSLISLAHGALSFLELVHIVSIFQTNTLIGLLCHKEGLGVARHEPCLVWLELLVADVVQFLEDVDKHGFLSLDACLV